jgi:hypothetical protein
MEDLLASTYFRYLLFPVGSALLGIFVKVFTRNDKYTSFKKEDLAVGLQLMTTGCLMYVLLTTDRALQLTKLNKQLNQAINTSPPNQTAVSQLQAGIVVLSSEMTKSAFLITMMFIGLWAISSIVRKWGWKSETENDPVIGIALPLVFGVLFLLVVMLRATQ